MNGLRIRLLEWSYPMVLWLLVALCTVLACRNVFGSSGWRPTLPRISQATFPSAFVTTTPGESVEAPTAEVVASVSF